MQEINQNSVDMIFNYILNQDSEIHNKYCDIIIKIIKNNLNIQLSIAEAEYFWRQHSSDMDAFFLIVKEEDEKYIIKHFKEFFDNFYYENP